MGVRERLERAPRAGEVEHVTVPESGEQTNLRKPPGDHCVETYGAGMVEHRAIARSQRLGAFQHGRLWIQTAARHLDRFYDAVADADHVGEGATNVDGEHPPAHDSPSDSSVTGPSLFHGSRSTEQRHCWHLVTSSQPPSLMTG